MKWQELSNGELVLYYESATGRMTEKTRLTGLDELTVVRKWARNIPGADQLSAFAPVYTDEGHPLVQDTDNPNVWRY